MNDFDLGIDIASGWCTLRLTSANRQVQIRTHWLVDGLTELSLAVAALLAGRTTVGVRWAYEIAGGHFVDFVLDPEGGLNIAVSELEYGAGTEGADKVWSAVRGSVVFRAAVPFTVFLRRYLAAMRIVRVRNVDASGMVLEWRHSFPQSIYEALERDVSARFGYKPMTAEEIGARIG